MAETRGNLYVISAPSGTGKTTLVKTLVGSLGNIMVSISHTTRDKRPAETDGVNYHFTTKEQFNDMIQRSEFLEHATVFENFYGTSRLWVEEMLNQGTDVILEIDWQGCQQIQRNMPDTISIFILPPSLEALSHRLTQRNQDHPETIRQRLADAQATVAHVDEYDYIVVNDNFDTAVNELKAIILAGRLREKKQLKRLSVLISELTLS